MKTTIARKMFSFLAIVVLVAGAVPRILAQDQPQPNAVAENPLPANIPPGSPVAEVLKLVQAGVDVSVIQSYITNCPTAFNLDADQIITLSDAGVPMDLLNAMIAHDKNFSAPQTTAAPYNPASTDQTTSSEVVAPTANVSVNYFYDNLSPYGSWVVVEGYGRCWRPTTVIYDTSWQPYSNRGHWVYTDYGWYWDSDYAWGVTFHYGRWFRDARYGWCWWPDTVWAPSWVTWRSGGDYCGWAPLPPFSVYRPGVGFLYRGQHVAIGFSFGLAASCYTFVPTRHFCDRRPHHYRVPENQITQIYGRTTVMNNYRDRGRTIVNDGVPVGVIGRASRRSIEPVSINTVIHSGRRGQRVQYLEQRMNTPGANRAPGNPSRNYGKPVYDNRGGQRNVAPPNNRNVAPNEVNRRPSNGQPSQMENRFRPSNEIGRPAPSHNNSAPQHNRPEQRPNTGNQNTFVRPAQNPVLRANNPPAVNNNNAPRNWSAGQNQVQPPPSASQRQIRPAYPQHAYTERPQPAPRQYVAPTEPRPNNYSAPANRPAQNFSDDRRERRSQNH